MNIFISYPSERTASAREIWAFLKSLGLTVWFDKESLIVGQDWDRERKEAQRAADLSVLLCSPETVERSGVIQREIKDILDLINDKPFGQIHLLPVRLEDIRLPPELAKYQYANYFEDDWKFQLARSVELKLLQLNEVVPTDLANFLQQPHSLEETEKRVIDASSDILDCQAEFFFYTKTSEYWEYVNSSIYSDVVGGLYDARATFTAAPGSPADPKNEWFVKVEEFFRSAELVSLRFFVDWYGSGAAHPNHHAYSKNFVGTSARLLTLTNLFEDRSSAMKMLLRYCDHDLRRQHAGGEDFEFLYFPTNTEEAEESFSQFNFDRHGITINFSPYAILSYADGFQEVQVPWATLDPFISSSIREGPLGTLIKKATV